MVSLTSFGPRINRRLELVLLSLMKQSVTPEKIVLWLTKSDIKILPKYINKLVLSEVVEIRETEDLKSYKKIIPAITEFPDYDVVTADDDIFYCFNWLKLLMEAKKCGSEIVCHRAHGIVLSDDVPAPYNSWHFTIKEESAGPLVFGTSGGGVIYPKHCLKSSDFKIDLIMLNFTTCDDIWLYFTIRNKGLVYKKIVSKTEQYIELFDPKLSNLNLNEVNVNNCGNDNCIKNAIEEFGRSIFRLE